MSKSSNKTNTFFTLDLIHTPTSSNSVNTKITNSLDLTPKKVLSPKILYLGPKHTYCHQAAKLHFGSATYIPKPSITEVFELKDADFGVIPVENSNEGSVALTLDLLVHTEFLIIGEILLPISHTLMGQQSNLKRIYAHPQSIAQCRNFLSKNFKHCELVEVVSNAQGAELAKLNPVFGAIASKNAAHYYGLNIIATDIQDLSPNITRFLILGKQPHPPTSNDKTSLLFAIKHEAGALNAALEILAKNKINMTKIESRPMRNLPWEYLFFIDILGHREHLALEQLARKTMFLKILGSYPQGVL